MKEDDVSQPNLWAVPPGSRLEAALGELSDAEYDGRPWVERLMEGLPEIEQEVIKRRFGLDGFEPSTFEEVGHALTYSRERIRQLQNQALGHISLLVEEVQGRSLR